MKKNAVKNVLIVVLMLFVFSIFINQNHINATTLGEINHTIRADKEVLEPGEAISITIRINEFTAIPGPQKNIQAYLSTLKYDLSLFDVITNGGDQAQGLIYLDQSTYVIHPHNAMFSMFPPDTFQVMYHEKEPELIIVQAFFSQQLMLLADNDFDVVTITFYAKEGVNGIGVFEMTNDAEWSDTGYAPYQGDPNNLFTINNSLAYLEIPVGNTSVINSTITFKSLGGTTVESIVAEVGATISEPTSPSKTGYIFDGWYLSHNNGITLDEKFVFDVMPEEDITLYAKWIPITYQIEFNANGGTGNMSSINGTYDQEVELPSNTFTRAGYKFLGWATNPTGQVVYSNDEKVLNLTNTNDSTITLYAVWEEEVYDINYHLFGGTNHSNNKTTYKVSGLPITLFSPAKIGYIFDGWYDNDSFIGTPLISISIGTVGNINLYAKWTPISYNIAFDANGGFGEMNVITANYDQVVKLQNNIFTKIGHKFAGWATTPTGPVKYSDAQEVSNLTNVSDSIITLYAVWEKEEYTLTIDSPYIIVKRNGVNLDTGSKIYYEDVLIITYIREGYSSGNIIVNGVALTGNEYTVGTDDVTITVINEVEETYTITYDLDGGINNPSNPTTYTINTPTITLENPGKQGYNFLGWFDSKTGGSKITTITQGSTGSITLYARWEEVTYTITYHLDGGSNNVNNPATYKASNLSITLFDPTKNGYTFIGWYDNEELSGEVVTTISEGTTGNIDLYAKWEVITYTITYDLDGGINNPSNPTTYTINTPTITLENPGKQGYNFLGWFDSKTGGSKITTITQGSTGSITLYARWEEVTYTITYHLDGGSNNVNNPATYKASNLSITLFDPTKNGYTFIGWYDNEELSGEVVTTISEGTTGNIDLYAKWEVITYTITYDLDGGINNPSNPTTYTINTPTITLENPDKQGYNFLGWFDSKTGGSKITTITQGSTGSITLYARWEEKGYELTFNPEHVSVIRDGVELTSGVTIYKDQILIIIYIREGYSSGNILVNGVALTGDEYTVGTDDVTITVINEVEETYTITYDLDGGINNPSNPTTYTINTPTITLENPGKQGYNFLGWFDSKTGGSKITTITQGSTGSITLYARWEEVTYTITYHLDGGSNNVNNPATYKASNLSITLFDPTKNGYTFIGWYDNEELSGEVVTTISEGTTGNIDLYAKWEVITYTITYDLDGGINNPSNPTTYTINTPTITLENPGKQGYNFLGWFDSKTGGSKITTITQGSTGSITLYARWEEVTYTITYHLDGGSNNVNNPATYKASNLSITLFDPTKNGYTFIGWYDNEELSGEVVTTISEGTTGNIDLYAKWEVITYTITYDLDGGINNPSNPTTYTINTPTITLENPGKQGYNFLGWFDSKTGGSKITTITQGSTGSITLYARWEEKGYELTFNPEHVSVIRDGVELTSGVTIYKDQILIIIYIREGYSSGNILVNGVALTGDEYTVGTDDVTITVINEVEETYTITYDLDGGINNPSNPTTYTINTPTITLENPGKQGYNFLGWFDSKTGGSKITTITQGSTGSITLYARWEEVTYTITYHLDGGSNNVNNPATYKASNLSITLFDPTKNGYTFIGWYDNEELSGEVVTTISEGTTGNIDLYAKWEVITYTITYDLDGGINNPSNPTTYTINTPTITLENPGKQGYNFLGWFDSKTGGSKITTITQGSTGSITLYARWEEKGYELTFNPEHVSVIRDGVELTSGVTIYKDQILIITYIREGYSSGNILVNGVTLTGDEYTVGTDDVTITVINEVEETYTITYDLDGGINNPSNPTTYTINTPTITLENPDKQGYNFLGWFDSKTGGSKITTITQGSTGSITLYARWEEVEGYYDLTLKEIRLKTLDNNLIKTIDSIDDEIFVIIDNPYDNLLLQAIPTFDSTTVSSEITVALEVGVEKIVEFEVISLSGDTKKYKLIIVRDSQPILTNISFGQDIEFEFDGSLSYLVDVNKEVDKLDLLLETNDELNKVYIDEELLTLENLSSLETINLNNPGEVTVVTIVVKSYTEETETVYTLTINRAGKSNQAKLTNLVVEGKTLYQKGTSTPGFSENIYDYLLVIPFTNNAITVIPTAVEGATFEVICPNQLVVGENLVRVIVTSEDGSKTQEYTITVTKLSGSSTAEIEEIKVIDTTTNESRIINNIELGNLLSITVPYEFSQVKFEITLSNESVNASVINPGVINLVEGDNIVIIKTIAEDETEYTYQLIVEREFGDTDATLAKLKVSDNLNQEYDINFKPDLYLYAFVVNIADVNSLKVQAISTSNKASVIIGDENMNPYNPNNIVLDDVLDIYIWVIPQKGAPKAYIVHIVKDVRASIPQLSTIIISDGSGQILNHLLNTPFKADVYDYTLTVDYTVNEIFIAGIGVSNAKIISGQHTTNLQTLPQENIIEVVVEAEDGLSTATYIFTVYRLKPSHIAELESIRVNDDVITIEKDRFNYQLEVSHQIDSVVLIPYTRLNVESIVINGVVFNEKAPQSYQLSSETTQFVITVTAEDKVTKATYILVIAKKDQAKKALIIDVVLEENDANFMDRTPSGDFVKGEFKQNRSIQYIFVPARTDKLDMKLVLDQNNKLEGFDTDELTVTLDYGYNIVPLVVVAEDGVSKAYYFFIIHRDERSSDCSLKELKVNNEGLELVKKDDYTYTIKTTHRISSLDLVVELNNPHASYQIVGNDSLGEKDIVQVVVTAEDGTVCTYTITVTQESGFNLSESLIYIVLGFLLLLNVFNLGLLISLNRRY